jgi:predicted DNA-binding transcriptional regulator YafY
VYHKQAIEREVNPYKLWYVNNGLYLVGHDHREDALRTFAVERIQSARLTSRRFEIPPDFNFEEFKKTAFSMIWGEPQEVKIRFSPSQAPYIRERTWHPSQEIETCDDGSIPLRSTRGSSGCLEILPPRTSASDGPASTLARLSRRRSPIIFVG